MHTTNAIQRGLGLIFDDISYEISQHTIYKHSDIIDCIEKTNFEDLLIREIKSTDERVDLIIEHGDFADVQISPDPQKLDTTIENCCAIILDMLAKEQARKKVKRMKKFMEEHKFFWKNACAEKPTKDYNLWYEYLLWEEDTIWLKKGE